MNFILQIFSLITIINLTLQSEINWLKPSDYYRCEWTGGTPKSREECNDRWSPYDHESQVYKDYTCCLVKFKMGDEVERGCYIIEDSKTGRKRYHNRVLKQFDDVEIICSANYLKLGFMAMLLFLLF